MLTNDGTFESSTTQDPKIQNRMKVLIMNMPWIRKPGTYNVAEITRDDFINIIKLANELVQETPSLYHADHLNQILSTHMSLPLPFSLTFHDITPADIGIAFFRDQDGHFKYFRVDYSEDHRKTTYVESYGVFV